MLLGTHALLYEIDRTVEAGRIRASYCRRPADLAAAKRLGSAEAPASTMPFERLMTAVTGRVPIRRESPAPCC